MIVENLQEPAAVPTAEPPKKVTKKKTETPDIAAVEPSSPTSSVKVRCVYLRKADGMPLLR